MVGIVVVSHSDLVARGVKDIAGQMAPEVKIEAAGGTEDNRIGTGINKITEAIEKVYSEDGVMIFFDLGSAFMNTDMAIEFLDDSMKEKIQIIDAPLVEGVITAAVECSMNKNIEEIKIVLKEMALNKI
ncbi:MULTISPECIES: dihydroxyacetone kinase phosphoryl donor subunit DhaM [Clostridium]|uniref:phosphoenolpyruvate--glycerone phosphotransferase n=3 Tax=Clostridium TaxID=1485 RepID=A0AAV3W4Z1_9CLOT|nr:MULTISPECIES: dihydroxyacetone kinase phosphoryl donor subunit DhaM [Clostridium]ALB44945.1 PTS-dependent dihydroxyacetone kinase phosphotransferase subunit DhaM [Clostridium beijerinckii NRRL B-598]MBE6087517.1 PTS-dependent dihydroxyacetone kinase phosphotransferase subunit DhaM [Clostridium beijerinckii]MBN7575194.1 PTS-dependent dihydroxyacetone kinase phosphotransferase subunit DhaM [Clostridium beijerinckii]MBN7580497.1 PTS-dependent dihydroxyacetone kinase phosphotransferase subunit D